LSLEVGWIPAWGNSAFDWPLNGKTSLQWEIDRWLEGTNGECPICAYRTVGHCCCSSQTMERLLEVNDQMAVPSRPEPRVSSNYQKATTSLRQFMQTVVKWRNSVLPPLDAPQMSRRQNRLLDWRDVTDRNEIKEKRPQERQRSQKCRM
jgi:hypothetical protein